MRFIDFPQMNLIIQGMEHIKLPRMMKVKQLYDNDRIMDIAPWVEGQMETVLQSKDAFAGKRICITVGSRGIPQLELIVKTIVDKLKEWGASPFIVPAMGSHGGATAEGQKQVLEGYNITEETMGAPILATMDVVEIGRLPDGTPVYCDKYAYESDGIVVMNKIKPHTDFRAKNESGMAKMMAIGMGNHKGASMFHMMGFATFGQRIPEVCNVFMEKIPLMFGVGIIQNAYDQISAIEVVEKHNILQRDAELQQEAKKQIANFKFPSIDVLIVDEIGKNISGNGHDPNVTGRSCSDGFRNIMDLKKLFVRSLNEATHHNGCGLASADITTRRCLRSVDFEATWTNAITCTALSSAHIPLYMENDRDALMLAIRTCNGIDFNNAKIARIKNTLSMEYIEVSENYLEELKNNPGVELLSDPYEMQFDQEGFLI